GYPASLHHADLKMSLRRVGCQLHRRLVVMRWASVVMVAVAAHVVIVIVRRPRAQSVRSLCIRCAILFPVVIFGAQPGALVAKGLGRYAAPALSLPRAQGDERIEYHPVDLQALAECALARAKCPLGRNADVIDAGPPWRRLDAVDQLRHLPLECVGWPKE